MDEQEDKAKYVLPFVRCHIKNLLLAGKEEKSLTKCLLAMVEELEKNTNASELQLSVFDGATPIFNFHPVSGRHRLLTSSVPEAIQELEWANEELKRRYEVLSKVECANIKDYNKKHVGAAMPRILFIIHELGELMEADGGSTERLLVKLLARARAVGFYVICTTTRIRSDVLTSKILTSLDERLVFRTDSRKESELLGLEGTPLPKYARPYRGNPATEIGGIAAEHEKHGDATRLAPNEAIFIYYETYITGFNKGRFITETERREEIIDIEK